MVTNELLTDAELVELTGYERAAMQCKALESMGVWFHRRADGKPRTTWHHINHPYNLKAVGQIGPRFDQLD
jgi:hypothetical protein